MYHNVPAFFIFSLLTILYSNTDQPVLDFLEQEISIQYLKWAPFLRYLNTLLYPCHKYNVDPNESNCCGLKYKTTFPIPCISSDYLHQNQIIFSVPFNLTGLGNQKLNHLSLPVQKCVRLFQGKKVTFESTIHTCKKLLLQKSLDP